MTPSIDFNKYSESLVSFSSLLAFYNHLCFCDIILTYWEMLCNVTSLPNAL